MSTASGSGGSGTSRASSLRRQLKTGWQRLAPREKTLVAAAVVLVSVVLGWWLALAPALTTLRSAGEQHRSLDAQLQRMLGWRAQAVALQSQPRQNYDEALRLLEASVKQHLGSSGRMQIAGERVTVTLAGTPPDALALWLTQARVNARALPGEARLARNATGSWDGTLVLSLPPR